MDEIFYIKKHKFETLNIFLDHLNRFDKKKENRKKLRDRCKVPVLGRLVYRP